MLWFVIAVAIGGCDLPPAETREVAPTGSAPVSPAEATAEDSVSTETGPATYTNETYGFSFRYPINWTLMEGENFVSLSRGTVTLVVGYRHVTEDPNICCRQQPPEGEIVDAGSVVCAGEEIDRAVVRCEGETKAVIYQGTREVAVGDLRLLFYLEDFGAEYDAAEIPEDVQVEVDSIIRSLDTFEPAAEFAEATARPTKLPPTPTEPPSTPQVTAAATALPATSTPSSTRPRAAAKAQPGGANLRSGPGTDYGLTAFLEGGAEAEIIGRRGDWWQIRYRGRPTWVYAGVVDASRTSAVPEVETVPTRVPSSPALIPTAAEPSTIKEERWIDVDLSEQRLRAYAAGEMVRTTLVSTGLPDTPTVRGQYRIWIKLRHDDMEGDDYYLEDVPYVMYFYQGYGLHGTFWHSNFGRRMSHGCVNLPRDEAEWVFNFVDVGTLVNIHE